MVVVFLGGRPTEQGLVRDGAMTIRSEGTGRCCRTPPGRP